MRFVKVCFVLFTVLLLSACGGGGGSSDSSLDSDAGSAVDTQADIVKLTTSLETGTVLSQGGQLTVSASVTYDDADGNPVAVADGVEVSFVIGDGGGGQVTPSATTTAGLAIATYSAGTFNGNVSISCTVVGTEVTDSVSFDVATGEPASVQHVSSTPETIAVIGTGSEDTSIIIFEVRDAQGNIVPDGRRVDFSIAVSLSGGEKLSVDNVYTVDGLASVVLQSGTVSGPVDVRANYYDSITGQTLTTVAKVTVVSGKPVQKRLSIAVEHFSVNNNIFGETNEITSYLSDRYGNSVSDGTPVSFMTEGGTFGLNDGGAATTTSGVATATLLTSNPNAPDLTGPAPIGNAGLCRIVAYASGSESYDDNDGDGVYTDEIHDTFDVNSDVSEPYLDENDSGGYEVGELFIDSDSNGAFTAANGEYDDQTTIWLGANVVFSSGVQLTLNSVQNATVSEGQSLSYSFTVDDIYGNAPLGGTTYEIDSGDFGEVKNELPTSPLADLNGNAKTVSFTFVADDVDADQAATIRVVVTTPAGVTDVKTWTLTIEDVPAP